MKTNTKTRFIVQAALIAAIYVVLTLAFAPIGYGESIIEFRISEALTILPYFTPAAIPGLFIGCFISNLFSPAGAVDIIFGSLATLISAYLSYKIPNKYLVPLSPVVVNGLIIGTMLHFVYKFPLWLSIFSIAIGEAVVCYGLGLILIFVLEKYQNYLFPKEL